MVEVVLNPYSNFRDGDFTAEVEEMGIKEFGEEATRKAFISFTDGGAPITFYIEKKDGTSFVESDGKIKAFYDIGSFVTQCKKFGFEVRIDTDLDNPVFRTVPPLEGKTTVWKAKKSKSTSAEGETKEFTNFILQTIEGAGQVAKAVPEKKAKAETPAPAPANTGVPPEIVKAWKDALTKLNVFDMAEREIFQAVNKLLPDDDLRKSMHKYRKVTFGILVKEKFWTIDGDAKYSIAG